MAQAQELDQSSLCHLSPPDLGQVTDPSLALVFLSIEELLCKLKGKKLY